MVYAAQGDLLTAQCNVPIYSDPTNVGDINLSVGMIMGSDDGSTEWENQETGEIYIEGETLFVV